MAAVSPARPGDFNGDGYPDLAVGAPGTQVNGLFWVGAVSVFYGTANGLDTAKRQRLQQGVSWVPGTPEEFEEFGADHVSADLNADGYSDLAICSQGTYGGGEWSGALMLAFGSPTGLNRAYELWAPYLDGNYPADYCRDLASGDFDGDGYPDVAVRSGEFKVGPIDVVYGGPEADHRSKLRMVRIRQSEFVGELSAGDVTGDGFADLVVGASLTGGLALYTGSAGGLRTTPTQTVRTPGSSRTAVGDVDGDGFADVVAANPHVGPGGIKEAGLVRLWFGSSTGLDTARGFTLITQDTPGVPDTAEAKDHFGTSLAIGDVDGDARGELAISTSGEDLGTSYEGQDAGTVTVLYGKAGGLDLSRSNHFTQDSPGVPDAVENGDGFGTSLLFRDFSRTPDGRADLVVGDTNEDGQLQDEGAVFLLRSTGSALTSQGAVMYGPRQFGIAPFLASFGTVE